MPSIEYIEKTVSGAIAHLVDGADRVPVKNWQVTLGASLTGYSSLGCSQENANFAELSNDDNPNKNAFTYTTLTPAKIEWEKTLSGGRFIVRFVVHIPKAGSYTFSEKNNTGGLYIYSDELWGTAVASNKATPYTHTFASAGTYVIGIYNGGAIGTTGTLENIMCEWGNSASGTFEPYTAPTTHTVNLGRTVYGGSVDVVQGTGTDEGVIEVFDNVEGNVIKSQFNSFNKVNGNIAVLGTNVRITFAVESGDQSAYNRISNTYTADEQLCNLAPHSFAYASDTKHWYRNTVLYLFLPVADVGTTAESVYNYLTGLITNGTPLKFFLPYNTEIDFTFTPITPTPETKLGVNNFWADEGDSQVTYYAQAEAQEAYSIEGETLTDIADAIRGKTGNGTPIDVSDFADEISGIDTVQMVQYDSLTFDGDLYIELPNNLVSPNHSYFIDFTTETQADATGEHTIFGIKNEYHSNFVGIRYNSLRYQVGQNGGSTNISNSWDELTGRHTFLYDGSGTVYFDTDAHTYTYDPSNTIGDNIPLVIGSATATPRTGKTWKGKVHRFTIRNTSTNTLVADYVPCAMQRGNTVVIAGLLDLVSENLITAPSCGVANEEVSNG